ncbi:putative xyloglucan endotransglucosylase/hydrolase protein 26 [Acorus gramineus]|uniref:Xyloglucan endotransglucosylase/hydrolase n=1 Tax=Acorus gramineus TaxID=55184 RepID=A0AAV9A1I8_ACOGR|nr:putative xyloglucan endotransglucosylase/hydrolase protein 26 [Acorus gramineus]
MAESYIVIFALVISSMTLVVVPVNGNFHKSTTFNWGVNNSVIWGGGDNLALVLNNVSGSGIQTKKQFLFGSIQMLIKLVPGNSAGTVTAYYVSSVGSRHDEIDFEFLGNVSGQPYIIHTNVFAQGIGNREQQFYPWWLVDGLPIRVFRNQESIGIPYPNAQPMRVYSSIWNADNWATRGGLEKIDWKSAPFVARYRQFRARACRWGGFESIAGCASNTTRTNFWASPAYARLSYAQVGQMMWVRNNYMIYDYCKDTKRFNGQMPLECSQPMF